MGLIQQLEENLWAFIQGFYQTVGWLGVVVMMAIESACIPLPSEVIMPLAGDYLVRQTNAGFVGILAAGFFGGLGCTIGSIIAYWVGAKGGRPLIERYGKYILINKNHLHTADVWFEKYGEATVFFSRLLPVIRTFISFPAGIARMNFTKFVIYTFIGSFIWSAGLGWAGATWPPREIRETLRPFDIPIVLVIVALIIWFVIRNLRNRRSAGPEVAG